MRKIIEYHPIADTFAVLFSAIVPIIGGLYYINNFTSETLKGRVGIIGVAIGSFIVHCTLLWVYFRLL